MMRKVSSKDEIENVTRVLLSGNSQSSDSLISRLKELEKVYKDRKGVSAPDYDKIIPPTAGLTQKEFVAETEEEMRKRAEAELSPDYNSKVVNKTLDTENKLGKLDNKEITTKIAEEKEFLSADERFSNLMNKHKNSVINQGLVYSSINELGKDNIISAREFEMKQIELQFDQKYNEIKSERQYVTTSYQNALRDYNLKYALELEKKVTTLKEKQEKRMEEVNKYNQNIIAQEKKYQEEREKKILESEKKRNELNKLLELAGNIGENSGSKDATKEENFDVRYNEAYDYYMSKSREDAMSLIENDFEELESLLGAERFYKLYSKIKGR